MRVRLFSTPPKTASSTMKIQRLRLLLRESSQLKNLVYVWVVFYFYNGTTPAPGVFDEFNAIVPVSDSVMTQPYASLVSCPRCIKLSIANQVQLNANDEYSIYGFRYLYRVSETSVPRPNFKLADSKGCHDPKSSRY